MEKRIEESITQLVGRDSSFYNEARKIVREHLPPRFFWLGKALMHEIKGLTEGRPGIFSNVAIETTSICNRSCGYCPLSNKNLREKRGADNMDPELFSHIISQLAKENFSGKLALQGYGEPMLDPYFIERVKEAKKKLPHAYITFNSNGDFLTPEIFKQLIEAGISHIYITQHSKDKKPPLIQLRDDDEIESDLKGEINKRVSFYSQLVVLQNRGGSVDLSKFGKERQATAKDCERCISNAYTMTINVDGSVSACDNDFVREKENLMGKIDINQENLLDIWKNPRYLKIRQQMILRALGIISSGNYEVCNRCNINDHSLSQ